MTKDQDSGLISLRSVCLPHTRMNRPQTPGILEDEFSVDKVIYFTYFSYTRCMLLYISNTGHNGNTIAKFSSFPYAIQHQFNNLFRLLSLHIMACGAKPCCYPVMRLPKLSSPIDVCAFPLAHSPKDCRYVNWWSGQLRSPFMVYSQITWNNCIMHPRIYAHSSRFVMFGLSLLPTDPYSLGWLYWHQNNCAIANEKQNCRICVKNHIIVG